MYLRLALILTVFARISLQWTNRDFSIDSKLPKLCGEIKSYTPESQLTYPWIGYLSQNGVVGCVCVLIHAQVAITGALCIRDTPGIINSDELTVSFSLRGLPSYQNVIVTHVNFFSTDMSNGNNFAILKFERQLLLNEHVQPICLWEQNDDVSTQLLDHNGLMIGSSFRDIMNRDGFQRVLQAPVQVSRIQRCRNANSNFICILHLKETTNCHYFGSALMFPRLTEEGKLAWYLRGLQSQRFSNCRPGSNNTVLDLGVKRQWIESKFRPSVTNQCGRRAVLSTSLVYNPEETRRGDFPWQVAIFLKKSGNTVGEFQCGGSIISNSYILTAAHCVHQGSRTIAAQRFNVLLGKYDFTQSEPGASMNTISQIIVHEGYEPSTLKNDIALMKISTQITFNEYVQPVCLWEDPNTSKENIFGLTARVPGWGFNENNMLSSVLYAATMPIREDTICYQTYKEFYRQYLTNLTICAGNPRGQGAKVCNGDSGGGLVLPYLQDDKITTWFLRGIVSVTVRLRDRAVCDPDYYAIYTDVAQYLKWIASKTNN